VKGDFTRSTFRREKHYSSVRMQQGRVQLDADWNEQLDIQVHHDTTTRQDVIGLCGAPIGDAGFEVLVQGANLEIGGGRYYVDGILCENEQAVLITAQGDLPDFQLPTQAGVYVAYLDVWKRHLTYLQDDEIREVALGGPDTATRIKTVWQVKLLRVGNVGANVNCLSNLPAWNTLTAPSSGQLRARAQPGATSNDPCIVAPGAGFRRLENQLYRVEIHVGGGLGTATFKWSRDNGSIAAGVESIVGDEITLAAPGRDSVLGFAPGQWIELTDEVNDLLGQPGTLVRIDQVDGRVLTVDTATATGSLAEADFPLKPKVRRWDSAGALAVEVPAQNDGYIPLEDGVEIRFEVGTLRTGDYWMIPARTLTGEVEWPVDGGGQPVAQDTHGIRHHFCRLALLEAAAGGGGLTWTLLSDCRELFPPLTQLTSLFYVSGDGQEALHDPSQAPALLPLPQPLQVGVSLGQWPVEGATVRFEITEGNGRLQGSGASVDVATGADGIATCAWELDSVTQVQEVQATLRNANGDPVHLPVRFSATLTELTSLFYVSGDGQEATPDPTQPAQLLPLPQPLQVGVAQGTRPVQGATVRFAVTAGGGRLQASGASVDVVTGADGVASCPWELDSTTQSQQVQATLLDSGSAAIHLPMRFTANLSVASQVAYDPSACQNLQGATTVQQALDLLCQMGGATEPGVVIRDVRANSPNFNNDAFLLVTGLVEGIQVICDQPVDPATISHPTCFVTLDLPYPFTHADRQFWSPTGGIPPVFGFEPLILAGRADVNAEVITWRPLPTTAAWLLQQLFAMMRQFDRGDRILGHLTLKGNFIWAENDPDLFLDGEAFGAPGRAGQPRTVLRLPSGNGRRGGDFEMWFWLVESIPVAVSGVTINRTRVNAGSAAVGTVTLAAPAPAGGLVVNLSSSDPTVSVPRTVTVPEGATSVTFDVQTRATAAPLRVEIEASGGGVSQRAALTVRPVP
jgi:hypothetical protein